MSGDCESAANVVERQREGAASQLPGPLFNCRNKGPVKGDQWYPLINGPVCLYVHVHGAEGLIKFWGVNFIKF